MLPHQHVSQCISHFSKSEKNAFKKPFGGILREIFYTRKVYLIYSCGSAVATNTKSGHFLKWIYFKVEMADAVFYFQLQYTLISNDAHHK